MNKVLKWVLIGLGIAVVAFGVALAAFRGLAFRPLMMGGRGFGFNRGFGGMMIGMGLSMIFKLLLTGGVVALAIVGIVSIFRHDKKISNTDPAQVSSEPVQPEVVAGPEKLCEKCGKPLQADWKNCPYCGKKI